MAAESATTRVRFIVVVSPWNILTALTLPAPEVGVVFGEQCGADGREDVEIERVFERYGAVRHPRRNAQNFTLPHHHFPALELELQSPFEDIGDLLAFVPMFGHHGILLDEDLRDHRLVAAHDLARDQFAHLFQWNGVPGLVFHPELFYTPSPLPGPPPSHSPHPPKHPIS